MRKRTLVRLIAFLVPIVGGIYLVRRNDALKSGFDQITLGELRSNVVRRLGVPSSSSVHCQNEVLWLNRTVEKLQCVEELRYDALILPKYWTIGFSKDDRAITKYEYVSP